MERADTKRKGPGMVNKKSTSTSRARATRTSARSNSANSMRNNRNQRFMILVALLAAALVGAIGVAVAAFSQDLKIEGTATVKGTSWDIHFENLKDAKVISTLSTASEKTKPTIDGTTTIISNYEVELKSAGDAVEYTFDVKNAGDIDAKITAITLKTGTGLNCSSTKGTQAEQTARNTKTCSKLNYTLTYANGTTVAVGDLLDAQTSKTMKLKLELDPGTADADLPNDDVSVSDLGVVITYGQQ